MITINSLYSNSSLPYTIGYNCRSPTTYSLATVHALQTTGNRQTTACGKGTAISTVSQKVSRLDRVLQKMPVCKSMQHTAQLLLSPIPRLHDEASMKASCMLPLVNGV